MLHSGYEVEKVAVFALLQGEKARYLSIKGNHNARESAGVTCGLWKRVEKGLKKSRICRAGHNREVILVFPFLPGLWVLRHFYNLRVARLGDS